MNDLQQRTKEFAHRCVKLSLSLQENTLGEHIQRQLIRCGTSVAANYRSACLAHSKASFASKISIAAEEVDEACFWMEFVIDESLIKAEMISGLLQEGKELTAILLASRKTAKKK